MKKWSYLLVAGLFTSCAVQTDQILTAQKEDQITIAFGSCDNQKLENKLWTEIPKNNPDIWIWGGDDVYCDTDDMKVLEKCYKFKNNQLDYKNFKNKVKITGTWDDHDYARNDGGEEFEHRKESQQLFLDFMNIPKNDKRRTRNGVYNSVTLKTGRGKSVKILNLDTRFSRSVLTPDPSGKKRYLPQNHGTMLGEAQWKWLENQLKHSKSEFNIIVSSVQFLSGEHGFEAWGNMTNEVKKMEDLIANSGAKNVIILSGDRHIAEFSQKNIEGLSYPLIDFTSSGMTHVYEGHNEEYNPYRRGITIKKVNFGVLKINLQSKEVQFEIRGINNELLETITQKYY